MDIAPMNPAQARARAAELGLVDPTAEAKRRRDAAPRLDSVAGTTVGLLDNRKGNARELLERIGDLLVSDHGVAEVYDTRKFVYSRRAEPEILEDLRKKASFIVTAVGD